MITNSIKIFIIFVLALGSLLGGSSLSLYSNTVNYLKTAIMIKEKKCSKCGEVKLLTEFSKNKNGLQSYCRICRNKLASNYRHTKKGLITKIYSHQKDSSEHRGHNPPTYTKNQLLEFALNSPDFHLLYADWVESGYKKELSPSFDRDNDYKGYSFENFNKWMTWQENNDKASNDVINGINNKQSKAVIGVHNITGEVLQFYSINETERQLGIDNGSISKCCKGKGKHKSAGGYKWKYKKV